MVKLFFCYVVIVFLSSLFREGACDPETVDGLVKRSDTTRYPIFRGTTRYPLFRVPGTTRYPQFRQDFFGRPLSKTDVPSFGNGRLPPQQLYRPGPPINSLPMHPSPVIRPPPIINPPPMMNQPRMINQPPMINQPAIGPGHPKIFNGVAPSFKSGFALPPTLKPKLFLPPSTAAKVVESDITDEISPGYSQQSGVEAKVPPVAATAKPIPTSSATTSSSRKQDLNKLGGRSTTQPPTPPSTERNNNTRKRAMEEVPPALAFQADDFTAEASEGQKAILGVVLGITFVAMFLLIGIGLVAGPSSIVAMCAAGEKSQPFASYKFRSPEEEDRTPPELRGSGQGHPAFNGGGNGVGKARKDDFTYGRLILHDPPSFGCNPTSATAAYQKQQTMTSTLFAAHAAAALPSPAEHTTHDLISPKYSDEDSEDDDDDSDDTVYECPGLAAPGDMVVSNPFYLQGSQVPALEPNTQPKPISSQCSLFHHGIKGFN